MPDFQIGDIVVRRWQHPTAVVGIVQRMHISFTTPPLFEILMPVQIYVEVLWIDRDLRRKREKLSPDMLIPAPEDMTDV